MRLSQTACSVVLAGVLSLFASTASGALSDAEARKLADEVAAGNTTSLEQLKQAADQGDSGAQSALGLLYLQGRGVPSDHTQAVNWFQKAAEQGYAEAEYRLGTMYGRGQGVRQDYGEAAKWYRKAADQGFAPAQDSLGVAYSRGLGVPKDFTESVKWHQRSAEQGNALGQYNLGVSYMDGEGIPKNTAEAMKWFRLAAEQGLGPAQFNLGLGYEKGDGVPRDRTETAKWYKKAVEWGYAPAKEALRRVERSLAAVPETGSQVPTWQQEMDQARRIAASRNNYVKLLTPLQSGTSRSAGVYVFYNNPRPFCYTYMIPGEWVPAPEANAYRSRDGRAFAGVLFRLSREFDGVAGTTLVERAANVVTRENDKALEKPLAGVALAPFESARPGTWKWTAAPVRQGNILSGVAPKFLVDLSPEAIMQITIFGTPDDDGLARQIIETLRTTSDAECYWPILESMLKTISGEVTTLPKEFSAQQAVPHLEICTQSNYREDRITFSNDCNEPLTIQFMLVRNQRVAQGDVKPGEFFDTGLSRQDIANSRWFYTVCPAGHTPSVPFLLKYRDVLGEGRYGCVKK